RDRSPGVGGRDFRAAHAMEDRDCARRAVRSADALLLSPHDRTRWRRAHLSAEQFDRDVPRRVIRSSRYHNPILQRVVLPTSAASVFWGTPWKSTTRTRRSTVHALRAPSSPAPSTM